MTGRAATVASLVAVSLLVLAVSGCTGPPPALPTAVLDQGADGLSKDHPELTDEQLAACRDCHRASDAPAQ